MNLVRRYSNDWNSYCSYTTSCHYYACTYDKTGDSTWCGDYLIYEKFHFTATLKRIGKAIHHLFYEEGELAGGLYHINLCSHIRHALYGCEAD